MPEIAEVETMRRGFDRHKNKIMNTIYVNYGSPLHKSVDHLDWDQRLLVVHNINGSKLKSVTRKGKNLVASFESPGLNYWDVVISPRMTGQLVWNESATPIRVSLASPELVAPVFHPDCRVGFIFDDGTVEFRDARKLGKVHLVNSWLELPNLRKLGRDLLDEECDLAYLLSRVDQYIKKSYSSVVKSFLLDQTQIAGIGNYMAAEILFAAGIRPDRKLREISTLDWQRILSYSKSLASLMISVGGVTLRDYNTFDGGPGGGARFLQVYGKTSCPLEHPVSRVKLASRPTYFCEVCQE